MSDRVILCRQLRQFGIVSDKLLLLCCFSLVVCLPNRIRLRVLYARWAIISFRLFQFVAQRNICAYKKPKLCGVLYTQQYCKLRRRFCIFLILWVNDNLQALWRNLILFSLNSISYQKWLQFISNAVIYKWRLLQKNYKVAKN